MLPRSGPPALRSGKTIEGLLLPCLYRTKTILVRPARERRRGPQGNSAPVRFRKFETEDKYRDDREAGQKSRSSNPRISRHDVADPTTTRPDYHHRVRNRTLRPVQSDARSIEDESRPKRYDAIPFERPPPRSDPYAELELEGSTITPNERKAFEGLFKLKQAKPTQKDSETKHRKEALKGLDAILDAAIDDIEPDGRRTSSFPAALRPIAEQARDEQSAQATEESSASKIRRVERTEGDDIRAAASREIALVSRAMASAQTDVDIWRILHERVLNRVAALNPSNPNPSSQQTPLNLPPKKTSKTKSQATVFNAPATSPRDHLLLPQTLPSHLRSTLTHLRSFPSSPLPTTLLPTLAAYGPAAFALGASTGLYNMHLAYLFRRYCDLHGICDVLSEMDRQVYEFDESTLEILVDVLRYAGRVERGDEGESLRDFWGTEGMRKGVDGVFRWKEVVRGRVEERAIRVAREREEGFVAGVEEEFVV